MPAAPYPLGGEARDVVEDVRAARRLRHRRASGFAEGRAALARVDRAVRRRSSWSTPTRAGGSRSRRRSAGRATLPTAAARAAAVLVPVPPGRDDRQPAATDGRPDDSGRTLARRRRVVTHRRRRRAREDRVLAASDPATTGTRCRFPSYESSFRVLSVHVPGPNGRSPATPPPMPRRSCARFAPGTSTRGRRHRDAAVVRVHRDERVAAPRAKATSSAAAGP